MADEEDIREATRIEIEEEEKASRAAAKKDEAEEKKRRKEHLDSLSADKRKKKKKKDSDGSTVPRAGFIDTGYEKGENDDDTDVSDLIDDEVRYEPGYEPEKRKKRPLSHTAILNKQLTKDLPPSEAIADEEDTEEADLAQAEVIASLTHGGRESLKELEEKARGVAEATGFDMINEPTLVSESGRETDAQLNKRRKKTLTDHPGFISKPLPKAPTYEKTLKETSKEESLPFVEIEIRRTLPNHEKADIFKLKVTKKEPIGEEETPHPFPYVYDWYQEVAMEEAVELLGQR